MHTECIPKNEEGYAKWYAKFLTSLLSKYFNGRKGKTIMFILKRPNGINHLFYTQTDGESL